MYFIYYNAQFYLWKTKPEAFPYPRPGQKPAQAKGQARLGQLLALGQKAGTSLDDITQSQRV